MHRNLYKLFHGVAGIYAGSCVAIAIVDLRFIDSISSEPHSLQIFAGLLKNMGQLMAPQLVILAFLGFYFSVMAFRNKQPITRHLPLLALAMILAITLLIHIPINLKVFSGDVSLADMDGLVQRWQVWHWIRTLLAMTLPVFIVEQTRFLETKRS
jgi:ABC-type dipeptide/oligopeptide/nickel transport system permease component